jgi:hypothetical protein
MCLRCSDYSKSPKVPRWLGSVWDCTMKWMYCEVIVLWSDCTVKWLFCEGLYCKVTTCPSSRLCSFSSIGFNSGFYLPHVKVCVPTQCRILHSAQCRLLHKMPYSSCRLCCCLCRHGCSTWSDELLRVWLHLAVAGGRMPSEWPVCDRLCCPPYRLLIEVWQSFDWVVADCWNSVLGRRSDQVAGQSSTVFTYCT